MDTEHEYEVGLARLEELIGHLAEGKSAALKCRTSFEIALVRELFAEELRRCGHAFRVAPVGDFILANGAELALGDTAARDDS